MENLLRVLRTEGLDGEVCDDNAGFEEAAEVAIEPPTATLAFDKRN